MKAKKKPNEKWLFVDTRNGIVEEFESDTECVKYATEYLGEDNNVEDVRVLRVVEEYEPVSTGYTFKKIEG